MLPRVVGNRGLVCGSQHQRYGNIALRHINRKLSLVLEACALRVRELPVCRASGYVSSWRSGSEDVVWLAIGNGGVWLEIGAEGDGGADSGGHDRVPK